MLVVGTVALDSEVAAMVVLWWRRWRGWRWRRWRRRRRRRRQWCAHDFGSFPAVAKVAAAIIIKAAVWVTREDAPSISCR